MLSSLKIFCFPWCPPAGSASDENIYGQSEKIPDWPDSLEAFQIPPSLERAYLPAFRKAPASLTRLIIKVGSYVDTEVLDIVFNLIGPQINYLYNLLDDSTFHNVRILLLSSERGVDQWVSFSGKMNCQYWQKGF
jgi:hypothetical protein